MGMVVLYSVGYILAWGRLGHIKISRFTVYFENFLPGHIEWWPLDGRVAKGGEQVIYLSEVWWFDPLLL